MNAAHGLPGPTDEILASLGQHRVLTAAQVRAIHYPGRSSRRVRQVLTNLESSGLVAHVQMPGGQARRLWFLTDAGAKAGMQANALDESPMVLAPEQAAGQLRAHTMAVNDAAISFVEAARRRGDEFGPLSWRHEVVHPLNRGRGHARRVLRADAVFTYLRSDGGETFVEQRFMEVDRATLSIDRLASELGAYAQLFHAANQKGEPLWRRRYPAFPPILCVLAGARRETLERRRDTTVALLRSDPALNRTAAVSILICFAEDLTDRGPFAAIFRDFRDPEQSRNWLGEAANSTREHDV